MHFIMLPHSRLVECGMLAQMMPIVTLKVSSRSAPHERAARQPLSVLLLQWKLIEIPGHSEKLRLMHWHDSFVHYRLTNAANKNILHWTRVTLLIYSSAFQFSLAAVVLGVKRRPTMQMNCKSVQVHQSLVQSFNSRRWRPREPHRRVSRNVKRAPWFWLNDIGI